VIKTGVLFRQEIRHAVIVMYFTAENAEATEKRKRFSVLLRALCVLCGEILDHA
jgi:hypothetical protein